MRMMRILSVLLTPFLFPSAAGASPVFAYNEWYIGDGGTYNAKSYTTDHDIPFRVQYGTLDIGPDASVISVSTSGDAASVAVTGGEIRRGITVNLGNLAVSGGQVRGFDNPMYGEDAVFVSSSAQITGGNFTGGNAPVQAGSGVVASAGTRNGEPTISSLAISGGTFIGGTGSGGYYGGTTGYSLLSLGNTTVTGGHFLSPIAINGAYGGVADFVGTHLTYNNNILSGFLENGDPIHVQVFPSAVSAVVNDSGTDVRFFSGSSSGPSSPSGDPSPSPIPEPASLTIFGLMTALALGLRRSRRSRRAPTRITSPES